MSVNSCLASSWVQIDDYTYIDKDSINSYVSDMGSIDYKKRSFWLKSEDNGEYKKVEAILEKNIAYALAQWIVNYSNNTIALKAGTYYDEDGKPVLSYTKKDFELKYDAINPNSAAALWADLVKKPRILRKMYKLQQSNFR